MRSPLRTSSGSWLIAVVLAACGTPKAPAWLVEGSVTDLAISPRGAPVIATRDGVFERVGGDWQLRTEHAGRTVFVDRDDATWVTNGEALLRVATDGSEQRFSGLDTDYRQVDGTLEGSVYVCTGLGPEPVMLAWDEVAFAQIEMPEWDRAAGDYQDMIAFDTGFWFVRAHSIWRFEEPDRWRTIPVGGTVDRRHLVSDGRGRLIAWVDGPEPGLHLIDAEGAHPWSTAPRIGDASVTLLAGSGPEDLWVVTDPDDRSYYWFHYDGARWSRLAFTSALPTTWVVDPEGVVYAIGREAGAMPQQLHRLDARAL